MYFQSSCLSAALWHVYILDVQLLSGMLCLTLSSVVNYISLSVVSVVNT
jgi:hypothetical protein